MTKFGELIGFQKPVLIDFYSELTESDNALETLRNVAVALGSSAKIIKINIKKNEHLADSLHVKADPTFMIYKNGQMKWRETGAQDANTLIDTIKKYI